MAIQRDMKLLTASNVATLCEVDLKTIHNWVDRGCIPHFRTPGRHLRFRAIDIANFLRAWGYTIPRKFYSQIAHTVLVLGNREAAAMVSRAAGQSASVRTVEDLFETAIRVGAEPTSAIVADIKVVRANPSTFARIVSAVRTAYSVPMIVLGDPEELTQSMDVLFVPMGDSKMLRAALAGEVHDPAQMEEGIIPTAASSRKRGQRPGS
ncbi:MAG: hypothetical protein CSA75_03335 [Sorangium cellulosum]|nr:MAG: hypothetical protein CSA75_03335 [Sorangium cellulosum]